MILVVGAGLAGLTCAKVLADAGHRVRVLEAADAVGGRVRTDASAEGFRLDRGFQVLLTAYPAVQRHLNLPALQPRAFRPGAVLIRDGQWQQLRDPLSRVPLLGTAMASAPLPLGDKLRLARLRRYARSRSLADIYHGKLRGLKMDDRSVLEELRRRHFTDLGFIERYARPFYGGILLDHELSTSARMFLFTLKMLASGKMVLPSEGMGSIAEQLAARLPANSIQLETRVESIIEAEERAVGVTLTGGEEMQGDAIVIATDAPTAARLSGRKLPEAGASVTCVYLAGTQSLYNGPRLLVNGSAEAFVNHAVQISNVASTYAPAGQHLLTATVLGLPELDDAALAQRCREDMAPWFPKADLARWRLVATYRIRFARLRQPPGTFASSPPSATATTGLFVAGEYTTSSSIQGAMQSGEDAAHAVERLLQAG